MKFYDLHTHTTWSDGEASVEQLYHIASSYGYGLGISDHLFCAGLYTTEKLSDYLDALSEYDVFRGCEANIGENYTLPDRLASKLDYVIASIHSAPDLQGGVIPLSKYFGERAGEDVQWEWNIDKTRSEEYLEAILPQVETTMRTQRMDILGHCTVLPFYELLQGSAFLRNWEYAILSLCKKYNIALEISSLKKEPNLDMILRARQMGLRFAPGSDCHLLSDACNLDYALAIIDWAGLTESELFIPRQHRMNHA